MLTSHPLGKTGSKAAEDHTDRLAERHEHRVVDDETGNRYISVHTIFKQIGRHGIAETIEEIGADADECKVYPGFVVN